MVTADEIRSALPTAKYTKVDSEIFCFLINGVMIHPFNADGSARDIEVHITNVQNGDAIAHCTTIDEILDNVPPQAPSFTIETDGTHWAGRNERGEIEVVGYSEDDIMDYIRQHDILPYRVDYRPVGYSLGPS